MNNLNFNNPTLPLFFIPPQLLAAIQQQQQLQQLQTQSDETMSRMSEPSSTELSTSHSNQSVHSASTSGSQSVPLQSGCHFCAAPTGPNGRGLIPCACETVHYCTDEHKVKKLRSEFTAGFSGKNWRKF
jgi:hypothetical protein